MADLLADAAEELQTDPTLLHDIPQWKPVASIAFYLKHLTSYEVYTISPSPEDEGKYLEDSKNRNKDIDGRIGQIGRGSSKRNSWAKVQIRQELYSQDEIIEAIRKLDTSRPSTASKHASLYSNQRKHVENIINNKFKSEREGGFAWGLAQLHCKEFRNLKTEMKETTSITIYLKRGPRFHEDVISLYRERLERAAHRQIQQQMGGGPYIDQGKQEFVVVDNPPMPITSKLDVAPQNYASQERIGSMPLASEYDSNEQVADKPTVPADEELEVGNALRERRRRSDGSLHSKAASAAAGVSARKRNQPLPPIVIEDPNDTIAIKRARRTLAARKSRQRKRESRGERVPTTYASQDRIGLMPLASEYDSNQQDQRKTGTSSYWSVQDQNVFPILVEHYGTDYHGIAKAMETKTHIMVKNYYQRQVDSGKSDLEERARMADEMRNLRESAAPLPPQNMSQAQPQFQMPMQQQQSQQPQQQPQPAMNNRPQGAQTQFTSAEQAMMLEMTNRYMAAASEEVKNKIRMNMQERMDQATLLRYQAQGIDPLALYYRNQVVVRLRQEKQRQFNNLQLSQCMQTNTPQSTVPMQQRRVLNHNAFPPQYQNENLVQETGQTRTPLDSLQAWVRDDYWETNLGKQNPEEVYLVGEKRPDRVNARDAAAFRRIELAPLRYDDSETLPTKLIPIEEAVFGLQGLEEPELEDPVLNWNKPGKTDLGDHFPTPRLPKDWELERSPLESELRERAKLSWKEHITAMNEAVIEGPFTDSGYASVLKTNISRNDPPLPDRQQCPAVDDESNVKMGDEDTEDAKTIYSAATSIDLPQSQQYITELCGGIFSRLQNHFDSTNWNTLEKALPSLIKAFAVKIGHDSSAQVNQDIMYFIHKQHKGIVSNLKVMFCGEDDEQPNSCRSGPEGMSLLDKMSMWDKSSEIDTATANVELFEGVGDDDDEITNEVGLSMYHGIVLKSPSYEWLLSSLRKEFSLQWGSRQPRIMVENIRQRILDRLPTGTISKRRPLSACEVTFDLQWDDTTDRENGLFAKLRTSEILLSELITVTGCQEESQALTVEQYLRQTWPTYGLELLNILQKAISRHDNSYSVVLPDNAQLNAIIRGCHLMITAIGPAQFIAECAEQLAWLQAAVHSNNRNLAGYCAPSITNYRVDIERLRFKQLKYKGYCSIAIDFTPLANPTDAMPQKQSWWQDLVGKNVVIQGFPISRRPKAYLGLELSFELLLSSVRADEAIIDDGLVLLKGPTLTLKLFKDTDDVFLWRPFHAAFEICPCEEHHIEISLNTSYSSIDLRRLETGGHILGVCTDLLTTTAENSEGMCEKSSLPETKYVQHHTSRDIGPLGNSRNTAHNPSAINSNDIISVPPRSQDDEKDSRSSVSSQVDYPVSKNGLSLYIENSNGHLLSNDQILLAADSPSNATMPSQDESLDSDLLSISDSSEQFEIPESNAAVDKFIDDAVNKLLSGFRSTTQCQFSPGASGSSGQSVTQTAASSFSTTSNNSVQSRKKRRAAEDNDDADQDGFPKPPHKKIRHSPDKALQRSFACPYLKKDPVKHGNCCKRQLSRIRDVKQHLNRCHIPDFYCQWCLESDFRSEQALAGHLDLRTCLRNNDPTSLDGISNKQRKQLSCKSNPKISEEDQWFAIWEILFLTRARPSSAYMDTGLSMELRLFREYCDTHGPDVMWGQHESTLDWPGSESTAEQRQAFLQTAFSRSMNRVFEEYSWSTLSLESQRSRNASFPEQSGDSIRPTHSETPLSSTADSGIAVDSQSSPRDVSSRRYIPSQLQATFDNGEPSAWIPPVDETMQMSESLRGDLLDFSNEFLDVDGFDSVGLDLDFFNQP